MQNKQEVTFREKVSNKVSSVLAGSLALIVLIVVGIGLWEGRAMFPWLGWFVMGDVILLLGAAPILAIMYGYNKVSAGRYIPVDQWGGYYQKGKNVIPLHPLPIAASSKQGQITSVSEVGAQAPRLSDLITSKSLVTYDGDTALMFQGYRRDDSPRYGPWPGVIAVSGMQNVGKSKTLVTLALIALLQGAKVVVCDTHHSKVRSLYKNLQALEGYITFALTEKEVLRQAQLFSQELASRKNGSDAFPYVFILDEAASIMRSKIKEHITGIVEESSEEGHGFNLHMVIAVHDFSQDGLGDAKIRAFFNFIYCHRMQSDQSRFVEAFRARDIKKAIAALPQGHVIAKDEINEVEYLIMPMSDSRDALLVKKQLDSTRGGYNRLEIASPGPDLMRDIVPETPEKVTVNLQSQGNIPPLDDLPMKRQVESEPETEKEVTLNDAIVAYNQGATSRLKLKAALGCGENQARVFLGEINKMLEKSSV